MASSSFRIHQTLPWAEIPWNEVKESLRNRYKLTPEQSDKAIESFVASFLRPLSNHWFIHTGLEGYDAIVVGGISRAYTADVLNIFDERVVNVGPIRLDYRQSVEFEALPKTKLGPKALVRKASVEIMLVGKRLKIEKLTQMIALQATLLIAAVIIYAVLLGLLFYGIAVFALFLDLPLETTIAATREPRIGLALLCFLVALAGLFGRAISSLSIFKRRGIEKRSANAQIPPVSLTN